MGTRAIALADMLRERARSRSGWTAAVSGDVRLTYAELDRRVDRLAAALRGAGFASGHRLLWLGQNSHRALESLLAACRLGGFFCPANWRLSPAELAFLIEDSSPSVVIWQEAELGQKVREAIHLAGYSRRLVGHDDPGPTGYEALLAGAPERCAEVEVEPSSAAIMLYTAAFEGKPSGALLSHDAVLAQSAALIHAHAIGPRHVFLNSGPLFHVGTLMFTMATLVSGGCNVFTPRAEPEELLRLIAAENVTGAYIVEPTLSRMVELNADGRYDLSSLVTPPAGSAWDAMVDTTGSPWARRRGGYGQTEVFGVLTLRCLGGEGTSGLPIACAQVRVVDPEGNDVPPGEVGEIVARGPVVMLGYWNRPDLNAWRSRGGWHHTSDLGRREADGSLSFVGPMGRLIKSGFENIYPSEVETCLKQHPAVADAVVIGVPDPVWQQSVRAVVVLRPGASATEAELIQHCRQGISSYKKPRSVVFVDSLPARNGAVDHAAVDREHGGGGYPGAQQSARAPR